MNFHNEIGQLQVQFVVSQSANETDTWIFLSDRNYVITEVKEVHAVGNVQSLTANIKKTPSGTVQAPASGTSILSSAITLTNTATANTVVTATLSTTAGALNVNRGDLLGLDLTGTVDVVTGALIAITLEPR